MTRRRPIWLLTLTTVALLSLLCHPLVRAADVQPKKEPTLLAAFEKPAPETLDDLKAMELQVQKVVEKVLPCTVNVRDGGGQGSGVIVSEDGYVLTAGHVSREAGRVVDLTLNDGRKVKAKTLGANHNIDSGFLKITDAGKWPHAEMGKSAELQPGQWVVTTGHPGGYNPTRGTVVRLGRVLKATSEYVRTDCTIVGGDSGGPLFDMNGKVVGIHSRIGAMLSANIHVPVDTYRSTWDRLVKGDVWGNGFVGFSADRKAKGCKVSEVAEGSPAAKAGLAVGDVVVSFDGKKIGSFQDLGNTLREANVGAPVIVEVDRGEESIVKLTLTIGKREGNRLPDALGQIKDEAYKSSAKVLAAFGVIEDKARKSTAKVLCDGKEVALGTVVGSEGFILTKNSELKGKVTCKLSGGEECKATIVGVDDVYDLAMLKIESKGLIPVQWHDSKEAPVGHWVASAGTSERPVGIGVVSVGLRKGSRDISRSGYLGILLAEVDNAVKISEVMPDTAASKAGLKANDIVLSLGGTTVKDVPTFIESVGQHKPGDQVTLRIKRGDEEKEIKATLGKRPPEASRADIQNTMGGALSTRRAGFPIFIQHDTVLKPQECGGPVLDLDGKAVGINIARAGRVESYAIPSEALKPLLAALMSGKLAPKETTPEKTTADKVAEAKAALKIAETEKAAAEKKLADAKPADKKAAETEKTAAEKKLGEAKAALEKAEADLKKEKEKDSKTSK
jgi:serine protease Do